MTAEEILFSTSRTKGRRARATLGGAPLVEEASGSVLNLTRVFLNDVITERSALVAAWVTRVESARSSLTFF
jgi:hypothetical protein